MYLQERSEEINLMSVEIASESFWMEVDDSQVEFGLECECGHIEVGVWENQECSCCGVIIELGNLEIDCNCFQ